jgi:hypothetical protein
MNTTTLLQRLADQTTAILIETKADFSGVSQSVLNYRSGENEWSALECFEHLNRYNSYYLTAINNAIRKNQMPADGEEIKTTWIGKKSIAMMHPSNRRKQKTFKKMDPANSNLTTAVLVQFEKDQQRILNLVERASRTNINAKAVPVEFFKLLKMTIAEALEFVIVHEQRHLIQAHEALHTCFANMASSRSRNY